MTKVAVTPTSTPTPTKFDYDAFLAMHKGNLETAVAAQKVMFDLAQTIAKRQADFVKEGFAKAEVMFRGYDARKQPQVYVDEMKAAVEKAMADVKETVDLGIRAQAEVVDLFVKRATKNLEGVKALAA
jgi:hypothetical protein